MGGTVSLERLRHLRLEILDGVCLPGDSDVRGVDALLLRGARAPRRDRGVGVSLPRSYLWRAHGGGRSGRAPERPRHGGLRNRPGRDNPHHEIRHKLLDGPSPRVGRGDVTGLRLQAEQTWGDVGMRFRRRQGELFEDGPRVKHLAKKLSFRNDRVGYFAEAAEVFILDSVIENNHVAVSNVAVEIESFLPNFATVNHQNSLGSCLQQFPWSFRVIHHDLSFKGESGSAQENLI